MFVRFLIYLLLIYLLYKIIKSVRLLTPEKHENYESASSSTEGEDLVEDPVCHTYIPVSQACKKEISGKNYYFCSEQCSKKYVSEKNN